jgi:predicted RecB family nuclease
VPDFALRDGQTIRIYDWKTGKPDENVERQLTCYALFANKRWQVPLDRTLPLAVYLRAGETQQIEVTEQRAAQLKDHIRTTLFEMMRLLRSVEHNLPRGIEAFAPTDDPAQCKRCFFQELCQSEPEDKKADGTLFD